MRRANLRLFAIGAAALLAVGCISTIGPESPLEEASQSVDAGGAQAVSVEVTMGAGELRMSGGAVALMDADFRYRAAEGRPEVKYNVVGGHGRLIVRNARETSGGRHDGRWDLRLKDDLPLDLPMKLGAGAGRLNLGALDLRNLQVEIGAGELNLDLTGHPRHDVDVRVRGGVGEATLRLPRSAAVEVDAHGGIGGIHVRGLEQRGDKYVNAAYENAKVAMHVDVRGGIGTINLVCE